ncbi:MAG: hypothetical protein ACPL1K_03250, partial [Candidatus Kryptoniota bacterium]
MQRTAASPLPGTRREPAELSSGEGVLPVPLLPLKPTVGRLLAQCKEEIIMISKYGRQAIILFLTTSFIAGCGSNQNATSISKTTSVPQASSIPPNSTIPQPSPGFDISKYAFRESVDSTKQYLFYLHGKIIEDQGIPAVSPDYGEYEYQAILEKLSSYGFVVFSEQRSKNTDSIAYARRIAEQVTTLLDAGVPAENITVVGASQGAWITVYVSHFLENEKLNFVIMSICHPDNVGAFKQNQIFLYGNVLSIYDHADELA